MDNARDLLIGARGDCTFSACTGETKSQFKGDIDECMVFGRALSQPEVEAIYTGGYRVASGGRGGGH